MGACLDLATSARANIKLIASCPLRVASCCRRHELIAVLGEIHQSEVRAIRGWIAEGLQLPLDERPQRLALDPPLGQNDLAGSLDRQPQSGGVALGAGLDAGRLQHDLGMRTSRPMAALPDRSNSLNFGQLRTGNSSGFFNWSSDWSSMSTSKTLAAVARVPRSTNVPSSSQSSRPRIIGT